MDEFTGIFPAMLTPLDEEGNPAHQVAERLIDALIEDGADGLYLLGSTGIGPLLNSDERKQLLETAVSAVGGRVPLIVHVGANSTGESIELAKHAKHAGADAISSVGPIYYPHTTETVFTHYRRIGECTDLPFFPYHLQNTSSLTLPVEQFANEIANLPNVVGMKFTSLDVYQMGRIKSALPDEFLLFSGADEVLCHALLSGATGAIGSYYNLFAGACRRARTRCESGDIAFATDFMMTFQDIIAQTVSDLWGFMRIALQINYDLDIGNPRPPLIGSPQDWSHERVRTLIDKLRSL